MIRCQVAAPVIIANECELVANADVAALVHKRNPSAG
jgi:hypothetical protein